MKHHLISANERFSLTLDGTLLRVTYPSDDNTQCICIGEGAILPDGVDIIQRISCTRHRAVLPVDRPRFL